MRHLLGVLPQSVFTKIVVCCSHAYSPVTKLCVVAQYVVSSLHMGSGSNEGLQPLYDISNCCCLHTAVQPCHAMCTAVVHM